MECQYDGMKKKIQNIKSYHERNIEEEDNVPFVSWVLVHQLHPTQQANQLGCSNQRTNTKTAEVPLIISFRYKFEDDDDSGMGFDTKDDFMYGLEKDLKRGLKVPQEY
jgi:hypothetical protein